jgi:hypothetical protein
MTDDFSGFKATEWATVEGHLTKMLLSDGSMLWIVPNDPEYPSGFQVLQHAMIGGSHVVPLTDMLPYRAGALEWARRWLADRGLTTVPTQEQRERYAALGIDVDKPASSSGERKTDWVTPASWYEPRNKRSAKSEPVAATPPDFDPVAFAEKLTEQLKGDGNE